MHINPVEEVKRVRATLGCGLREAYDAVTRYGSADAAISALGTQPGQARENAIDKMDRQSRWYETLRNSGQFVPCLGGAGWRDRKVGEAAATPEELDKAMTAWSNMI